jgi:hypothetical protein
MTGTVTLNGRGETNGLIIGSWENYVAYKFNAAVAPVNLSIIRAGGQPYLTLTPQKRIFVSPPSGGKSTLAYFTDAVAAPANWRPIWCAVDADGLVGCRDPSRPTFTMMYLCGVYVYVGEPGSDGVGGCNLVKFNLPV